MNSKKQSFERENDRALRPAQRQHQRQQGGKVRNLRITSVVTKLWHDPVFSKVIAGGITMALASLGGLAWIGARSGWWSVFLATSPVPYWLLGLLLIATASFLIMSITRSMSVMLKSARTSRSGLPGTPLELSKTVLTISPPMQHSIHNSIPTIPVAQLMAWESTGDGGRLIASQSQVIVNAIQTFEQSKPDSARHVVANLHAGVHYVYFFGSSGTRVGDFEGS
jgi:hypothetical protein